MQPLLPKLKKSTENVVGSVDIAGRWLARGAGELAALSGSIDVPELDPRFLRVDSIPDMWARPALFEMALFDRSHRLHGLVTAEWRGALALFALRELFHFDVGVEEVLLEPGKDTPGKGREFLRNALWKLAPTDTLSSDTTWKRLYVVTMAGKPIGITSPTTLLCTAADYSGRITKVDWFDGQRLCDPTEKLNESQRQALGAWLNSLSDALRMHPGLRADGVGWNALVAQIQAYSEALGALGAKSPVMSPAMLSMRSGIFTHLAAAVKADRIRAKESHLRLIPSPGREPKQDLLIIPADLADQWAPRKSQEILVYGSSTLASIPFHGPSGSRKQFAHEHLDDCEWRTPDDIFTDSLLLVEARNAFPGALELELQSGLTHRNQPVTAVLPVRPELLHYLTAKDIARRTSLKSTSAGIEACLTLTLAGPDGNGVPVRLTKIYGAKGSKIKTVADPPVCDVWPDLSPVATNWKSYFTYSSGGKETFSIRPYVADVTNASEPVKSLRGRGSVSHTPTCPEALVCEVTGETSGLEPEAIEAGLILLRDPSTTVSGATHWTVGIDFGTTATNVYIASSNREPVPLLIDPQLVQVTAAGFGRTIRLYDDFLPPDDRPSPFLSLYDYFVPPGTFSVLAPLVDGHIYFLSDRPFNAGARGLASDLKWGTVEDRVCARAFLTQLALHVAVVGTTNGVRRISWRYSFPSAFSARDQERFLQMWRQVVAEVSEASGLDLNEQDEPIGNYESIVAAQYFADSLGGTLSTGAICIDIGGGTSDISIWGRNTLLWQSSLQFAGREIFSEVFRSAPDFVGAYLGSEAADGAKLADLVGKPTAFYAQLDSLLIRNSEAWIRKLHLIEDSDERAEGFVALLELGLSSVFYYLGLVTSSLVARNVYGEQMPEIYVGGNGARLLHWIASGQFASSSTAHKSLERAFRAGLGKEELSGTFQINLSGNPKGEAAFGLVSKTHTLSVVNVKPSCMAGEEFIESATGRIGQWDEEISPARLQAGMRPKPELPQLSNFIRCYAEAFNRQLPEPQLLERLFKSMASFMDSASLRPVEELGEMPSQPLFFVGMRELLRLERARWSGKP